MLHKASQFNWLIINEAVEKLNVTFVLAIVVSFFQTSYWKSVCQFTKAPVRLRLSLANTVQKNGCFERKAALEGSSSTCTPLVFLNEYIMSFVLISGKQMQRNTLKDLWQRAEGSVCVRRRRPGWEGSQPLAGSLRVWLKGKYQITALGFNRTPRWNKSSTDSSEINTPAATSNNLRLCHSLLMCLSTPTSFGVENPNKADT